MNNKYNILKDGGKRKTEYKKIKHNKSPSPKNTNIEELYEEELYQEELDKNYNLNNNESNIRGYQTTIYQNNKAAAKAAMIEAQKSIMFTHGGIEEQFEKKREDMSRTLYRKYEIIKKKASQESNGRVNSAVDNITESEQFNSMIIGICLLLKKYKIKELKNIIKLKVSRTDVTKWNKFKEYYLGRMKDLLRDKFNCDAVEKILTPDILFGDIYQTLSESLIKSLEITLKNDSRSTFIIFFMAIKNIDSINVSEKNILDNFRVKDSTEKKMELIRESFNPNTYKDLFTDTEKIFEFIEILENKISLKSYNNGKEEEITIKSLFQKYLRIINQIIIGLDMEFKKKRGIKQKYEEFKSKLLELIIYILNGVVDKNLNESEIDEKLKYFDKNINNIFTPRMANYILLDIKNLVPILTNLVTEISIIYIEIFRNDVSENIKGHKGGKYYKKNNLSFSGENNILLDYERLLKGGDPNNNGKGDNGKGTDIDNVNDRAAAIELFTGKLNHSNQKHLKYEKEFLRNQEAMFESLSLAKKKNPPNKVPNNGKGNNTKVNDEDSDDKKENNSQNGNNNSQNGNNEEVNDKGIGNNTEVNDNGMGNNTEVNDKGIGNNNSQNGNNNSQNGNNNSQNGNNNSQNGNNNGIRNNTKVNDNGTGNNAEVDEMKNHLLLFIDPFYCSLLMGKEKLAKNEKKDFINYLKSKLESISVHVNSSTLDILNDLISSEANIHTELEFEINLNALIDFRERIKDEFRKFLIYIKEDKDLIHIITILFYLINELEEGEIIENLFNSSSEIIRMLRSKYYESQYKFNIMNIVSPDESTKFLDCVFHTGRVIEVSEIQPRQNYRDAAKLEGINKITKLLLTISGDSDDNLLDLNYTTLKKNKDTFSYHIKQVGKNTNTVKEMQDKLADYVHEAYDKFEKNIQDIESIIGEYIEMHEVENKEEEEEEEDKIEEIIRIIEHNKTGNNSKFTYKDILLIRNDFKLKRKLLSYKDNLKNNQTPSLKIIFQIIKERKDELEEEEKEEAVTKIQSIVRGRKNRKRVSHIKEKKEDKIKEIIRIIEHNKTGNNSKFSNNDIELIRKDFKLQIKLLSYKDNLKNNQTPDLQSIFQIIEERKDEIKRNKEAATKIQSIFRRRKNRERERDIKENMEEDREKKNKNGGGKEKNHVTYVKKPTEYWTEKIYELENNNREYYDDLILTEEGNNFLDQLKKEFKKIYYDPYNYSNKPIEYHERKIHEFESNKIEKILKIIESNKKKSDSKFTNNDIMLINVDSKLKNKLISYIDDLYDEDPNPEDIFQIIKRRVDEVGLEEWGKRMKQIMTFIKNNSSKFTSEDIELVREDYKLQYGLFSYIKSLKNGEEPTPEAILEIIKRRKIEKITQINRIVKILRSNKFTVKDIELVQEDYKLQNYLLSYLDNLNNEFPSSEDMLKIIKKRKNEINNNGKNIRFNKKNNKNGGAKGNSFANVVKKGKKYINTSNKITTPINRYNNISDNKKYYNSQLFEERLIDKNLLREYLIDYFNENEISNVDKDRLYYTIFKEEYYNDEEYNENRELQIQLSNRVNENGNGDNTNGNGDNTNGNENREIPTHLPEIVKKWIIERFFEDLDYLFNVYEELSYVEELYQEYEFSNNRSVLSDIKEYSKDTNNLFASCINFINEKKRLKHELGTKFVTLLEYYKDLFYIRQNNNSEIFFIFLGIIEDFHDTTILKYLKREFNFEIDMEARLQKANSKFRAEKIKKEQEMLKKAIENTIDKVNKYLKIFKSDSNSNNLNIDNDNDFIKIIEEIFGEKFKIIFNKYLQNNTGTIPDSFIINLTNFIKNFKESLEKFRKILTIRKTKDYVSYYETNYKNNEIVFKILEMYETSIKKIKEIIKIKEPKLVRTEIKNRGKNISNEEKLFNILYLGYSINGLTNIKCVREQSCLNLNPLISGGTKKKKK